MGGNRDGAGGAGGGVLSTFYVLIDNGLNCNTVTFTDNYSIVLNRNSKVDMLSEINTFKYNALKFKTSLQILFYFFTIFVNDLCCKKNGRPRLTCSFY